MWFKKSAIERLIVIAKRIRENEADMKNMLDRKHYLDKQIMEIKLATYRSQMLTIGNILEKIFAEMYPSKE